MQGQENLYKKDKILCTHTFQLVRDKKVCTKIDKNLCTNFSYLDSLLLFDFYPVVDPKFNFGEFQVSTDLNYKNFVYEILF